MSKIERIAKNGIKGIVIEAGNTLILDKEELIKKADEIGVFIYGIVL